MSLQSAEQFFTQQPEGLQMGKTILLATALAFLSATANAQYYRGDYRAGAYVGTRNPTLTPEQHRAIEGIAETLFGAPPDDAKDYASRVTPRGGAPARGCEIDREKKTDGRGIVTRWRCPRGTVQRLGW